MICGVGSIKILILLTNFVQDNKERVSFKYFNDFLIKYRQPVIVLSAIKIFVPYYLSQRDLVFSSVRILQERFHLYNNYYTDMLGLLLFKC